MGGRAALEQSPLGRTDGRTDAERTDRRKEVDENYAHKLHRGVQAKIHEVRLCVRAVTVWLYSKFSIVDFTLDLIVVSLALVAPIPKSAAECASRRILSPLPL